MVTTADEAYRRAGGRRRYNKQRRAEALFRRLCILHHLHTRGYQLGTLTALADDWGVHRSTIGRDVRWLLDGTRYTPSGGQKWGGSRAKQG